MTWPTDDLATTDLDEGTDNPSTARSMLATLVTRVKSIIGSRGAASGVADLDSSGKVPMGRLYLATANGLVQLDGSGLIPLASLPATINAATLQGNAAAAFQLTDQQLDDIAAMIPTKGGIPVMSASNILKLLVGTNGQVLTADSAEALGLKWVTPISTPPADSVGSSELKESWADGGSSYTNSSTYLYLSGGWYVIASDVTDSARPRIEMYINGAWREMTRDSTTTGIGGIGAFLPCDGSNVRIKPGTTSFPVTLPIYYRKLA